MSDFPPEPRPLHEWASFDPITDVVTIYDVKYARELLRHFAISPPGVTFRIIERRNGTITISTEHDDAVRDMLAILKRALEEAERQSSADFTEFNTEVMEGMKAAIAKAEGRTL